MKIFCERKNLAPKWLIWLAKVFAVILVVMVIATKRPHIQIQDVTQVAVISGSAGKSYDVTDTQDKELIAKYLNQMVLFPTWNHYVGWRYGFSITQNGETTSYIMRKNQLSSDEEYWILMGNHEKELDAIAQKYLK